MKNETLKEIKFKEDTQYDKLAEECQMEQQWIKSGYEVE